MTSKHYREDRKFREEAIKEYFGEDGRVVFEVVKYDENRKRFYLYQITENAVLIVKATDKDLIITKMLARPSRIKRIWENPSEEVLKKAIANARDPKRFK